MIVWFGDATNGINRFFAGEVQTDKLCVGNACITELQLEELLNGQVVGTQSVQINNEQATNDIMEDLDESNEVISQAETEMELEENIISEEVVEELNGDGTGEEMINDAQPVAELNTIPVPVVTEPDDQPVE